LLPFVAQEIRRKAQTIYSREFSGTCPNVAQKPIYRRSLDELEESAFGVSVISSDWFDEGNIPSGRTLYLGAYGDVADG
jgi:hypothetical protein